VQACYRDEVARAPHRDRPCSKRHHQDRGVVLSGCQGQDIPGRNGGSVCGLELGVCVVELARKEGLSRRSGRITGLFSLSSSLLGVCGFWCFRAFVSAAATSSSCSLLW
jgi:hypothetical protein